MNLGGSVRGKGGAFTQIVARRISRRAAVGRWARVWLPCVLGPRCGMLLPINQEEPQRKSKQGKRSRDPRLKSAVRVKSRACARAGCETWCNRGVAWGNKRSQCGYCEDKAAARCRLFGLLAAQSSATTAYRTSRRWLSFPKRTSSDITFDSPVVGLRPDKLKYSINFHNFFVSY